MTITMSVGLLLLRVVVGLTLAYHGTQKLFGWFGGPGLTRLSQGFTKQGYKPVWLWVSLAILGVRSRAFLATDFVLYLSLYCSSLA